MEKNNLKDAKKYLKFALDELEELDEDFISFDKLDKIGGLIDSYIYRVLENIDIVDYLTDYEFSITCYNHIEVDSVYLDANDLAGEFDGHDLVERALEQIAAEEEQEKTNKEKDLEELKNKMDDAKQEKDKTVE
jgi:hypothetical protein|tara:strand:+ start:251 stop:652 length:402 start_codon:yes stop_codon:yes gene_type:complete